MARRLPSPRQLLTSLINDICAIPLAEPDGRDGRRPTTTSNPLQLVPAASRPLLTTLHVLFPALLLPALDLLDRGLVARVVVGAHSTGEEGDEKDGEASTSTSTSASAPSLYLVRSTSSLPSAHPRRGHYGLAPATAPGAYVVHLDAWNCTCAAFALAAFPAVSVGGEATTEPAAVAGGTWHEGVEEPPSWEFGGLSRDGTAGADGVPCCKHLLACLLADRWQPALGRYVAERTVGRAELAGIVADV